MNHPRNRAERLKNKYAKDLRTPKYKPRVVRPKDKEDYRRPTKKELMDAADSDDQS